MKKNILLILALQIAVSFIYGCAFEEQYVPDPKPAQKLNYTPIDENNSHTFIGKYMVNALKLLIQTVCIHHIWMGIYSLNSVLMVV